MVTFNFHWDNTKKWDIWLIMSQGLCFHELINIIFIGAGLLSQKWVCYKWEPPLTPSVCLILVLLSYHDTALRTACQRNSYLYIAWDVLFHYIRNENEGEEWDCGYNKYLKMWKQLWKHMIYRGWKDMVYKSSLGKVDVAMNSINGNSSGDPETSLRLLKWLC